MLRKVTGDRQEQQTTSIKRKKLSRIFLLFPPSFRLFAFIPHQPLSFFVLLFSGTNETVSIKLVSALWHTHTHTKWNFLVNKDTPKHFFRSKSKFESLHPMDEMILICRFYARKDSFHPLKKKKKKKKMAQKYSPSFIYKVKIFGRLMFTQML